MSLLELSDVSYCPTNQKIVSHISLKVEKGDWLTLTGPSGSGKSTLLKIVANLLSPTTGMVSFEGVDNQTIEPTMYRRNVSYTFQQPSLFGSDVKENLAFPFLIRQKKFEERLVVQALEKVELPASFLTKKIQELSGGEKQRVAFIRNVMFPPKLLLLDEVTVGLDEENKRIVHQFIKDVYDGGTTIIQVTHDVEELASAQHCFEIKGGEQGNESIGG